MSKKREHRATSKEAHESVKPHKEAMYEKIIEGLRKLKVGGTFEEISAAAGIEPAQCWKRLPEMVENGTVFNVGTTRTTSSGRKAMVRQLVEIKVQESIVPLLQPQPRLKQANLF